MTKKLIVGVLGILLLLLPLTAAAGQDLPAGKWWRTPQVAKDLNLTPAQVRELDKQFVQSRRKMLKLKSAMEQERFELETLMENSNLDEGETLQQVKRFEDARSRLAAEKFKFVVKVRKILGNQKFQQLKRFYQGRRQGKARQ